MKNFAGWLYNTLFTDDVFDGRYFPHERVLYSRQPRTSFEEHLRCMKSQGLTQSDFYLAVMKACGEHQLKRDATWFQVNVIDYAVWNLGDYGRYPYPNANEFSPLFSRMQNYPTEQGGPNYVGLVGIDKDWLWLMQTEGDYKNPGVQIRVCGSKAFCNSIAVKSV